MIYLLFTTHTVMFFFTLGLLISLNKPASIKDSVFILLGAIGWVVVAPLLLGLLVGREPPCEQP